MILVSQKGRHSGLPRLFTAQHTSQGSERAGMKSSLFSTHQVPYLGMDYAPLGR